MLEIKCTGTDDEIILKGEKCSSKEIAGLMYLTSKAIEDKYGIPKEMTNRIFQQCLSDDKAIELSFNENVLNKEANMIEIKNDADMEEEENEDIL